MGDREVEALSAEEARALLRRAEAARGNAYAPYSRFPVGAALLDDGGRVHLGANVENASYGLTTCAERSAVAAAVSAGARAFRAVAVAGPDAGAACMPCGSCRQILHEFAPDLWIVTRGAAGEPTVIGLRELFPAAFGPGDLERAKGRG